MSDYLISVIVTMCTNMISVVGLALLTGYTGMFSLGHAGFMCIGAYTSVLLNRYCGVPYLLALLGLPHTKRRDTAIREEALGFLARLGIEEYKDHQAGALPYGLQRRLEIARALAAHPSLLLLDEPAAGMNNDECNELVELLRGIHQDYHLSIMLIEHHIDVVLNLCDRIYVLNLGALLTEGTPQQIQSDPEVIRAYLGERRNKS